MPQRQSAPRCAAQGSFCIVANELDYLFKNGGIGSSNWLLAHVLARAEWRVHVLYCGPLKNPAGVTAVGRRLHQAGITLHSLDQFPPSPDGRVESFTEPPYVKRSDQVRYALEQLHQEHHFDLAEFAECGAVAFRPVQAKRAGLAFADLTLAVKLHSPTYWLREGNLQWMRSTNDLQLDFCERYSFEHADLQLSPCRYMLDYVRGLGWNVRPDAQVLANVFPELQLQAPPTLEAKPEIVFFGRLETRKGLELFLEAIGPLDPSLPVTFLGRDTRLANGLAASEYIQRRLTGRTVRLLTNLDRQQALDYLAGPNRLVVIASLMDNFPNTVLECAIGGIPFLASRVGGIPEILDDSQLQQQLLFEPNAEALRRGLIRYLNMLPDERRLLVERARRATDVAENHRQIVGRYEEILASKRSAAAPQKDTVRVSSPPLVTLAVPYYNLADFLPATLASLARQTYPNLEVLVLDDGSTDPRALRVFEQQKERHPQFRFLRQPNAGLGAARNAALREARGEFFLPVDADNVARPHMVERFVDSMLQNPGLSALTCYYLAFRKDDDLARHDYLYAYRPTGGPHVMASFLNVYGDANAIFRTEHLRTIGGYATDPDTTCEDWEAFVKLVHAGFHIDVLPDTLFYRRADEDVTVNAAKAYHGRLRILRDYGAAGRLSPFEQLSAWTALVSFNERSERLADEVRTLKRQVSHLEKLLAQPRYRLIDTLNNSMKRVPLLHEVTRRLIVTRKKNAASNGVGQRHTPTMEPRT